VAEQVLHPERADRGGTPVEGLDGVRAARAVQALQAGPAKDGGQDSGPSSDPAKSLLGGLGSKK
jgi:hypothetical protein